LEDGVDLGRIALRGTVGPLMIGHGTQKLFGWFGGHGPDATGGAFESMGLRPGKRQAIAAGVAETAGGALFTLGALTPIASTVISTTMLTAIRKAHLENGPWVTNGGYEYPLALIGASMAITESGPGRPSVDERWFPGFKGTMLALLGVAAAAAASFIVTSERFNEPAGGTQEGEAQDFPSDPAAEAPARKFTREPSTTEVGQSA
jgi:putative oxidoreductase